MFEDGRSKKVVFIAHCLLNQNAISDGTAVRPAAFEQLAYALLEREIGIVQMPCPELCCLGLDRGDEAGGQRDVLEENTRIRAEMQKPRAHGRLTALVEQVMWQIGEYHRHGFEILGVIGANRSPNCGVETTSAGNVETAGIGLFMDALSRAMEEAGISIPMTGLKLRTASRRSSRGCMRWMDNKARRRTCSGALQRLDLELNVSVRSSSFPCGHRRAQTAWRCSRTSAKAHMRRRPTLPAPAGTRCGRGGARSQRGERRETIQLVKRADCRSVSSFHVFSITTMRT